MGWLSFSLIFYSLILLSYFSFSVLPLICPFNLEGL
ncbi:hypothetical protein N411_08750 [Helicobacter pylori FD535]|nr:hypothetical protein N411_08750 [Helicobacter pylori FD535]